MKQIFISPDGNQICVIDESTGLHSFFDRLEQKHEEVGMPPKGTGHAPVIGKKKKKGRKCKNCGETGHRSDKCPVDGGDSDFEVTDEVKEEIAGMLKKDYGANEVSDYYGISIKEANYAIAKTRGYRLKPNDEE